MTVRRLGPVVRVILLLGAAACTTEPSAGNLQGSGSMQLTSDAFVEGGAIPPDHSCDGADTSPPLAWSGVPDGVAAFALVVDDPDAGGFVHWVLSDVPGDRRELEADEGDAVGVPGRNDFGRTGWGGPCPPSGEHRYVFTLYALDGPLDLGEEARADDVRRAVAGHVLAETSLTGLYTRRR